MAAETVKPQKKYYVPIANRPKPKRPPGRPINSNKPIEKQILPMLIAGMTEREISKALDKPKTTVHDIITKSFSKEQIKQFRQAESDAIAEKRVMILNSIDQDEIKQACPRDKVMMYGILFDKDRLLRGESTANVAYDPGNIRARMDELKKMLEDADTIDI